MNMITLRAIIARFHQKSKIMSNSE